MHQSRRRHLHRPWSVLCVASAAALVVACGGQEGPTAGSLSNDSRVQPMAASASAETTSNQILPAAAAGVPAAGDVSLVIGYLGWSPQARRVAGAPATFEVQPARNGHYELFLWWPQNLKDAGEIQVSITGTATTASLRLDQRVDGGQWVSLGFHRLQLGQAAKVSLSSAAGAPVYVDALRAQYASADAPALQWRNDELAVGEVGTAYDSALVPAGGNGPYIVRILEGRLPPGLRLDETTGAVRGTPSAAGRFPLVFEASDAAGGRLQREQTLVVDEPQRAPAATGAAADKRSHAAKARALSGGQSSTDLSNIVSLIAATPEGGWVKANLNSFSEVWTPADLRPLYRTSNPTPSKIILAWSSFTWDSNRAKLILYGGGHANYRGNDVYMWNASSRLWERASLPSEMTQDALGNWVAVDGSDKAPASAHTYDNTMFFPLLDRMVALGGAADPNGGHYLTADSASASRKTGPYLFDPSKADGDKVGGSTGSHVKRVSPYPAIVGGNMWENREAWLNANANSAPPSESFVNSCTGVTEENGQDVAYVRTPYRVYRYRVNDIANPAADTWQLVGRYYNGSGAQATCSYDHHRRALVTASRNAAPFLYWNMATAASTNNEVYVTATDPTGEFQTLLSSNAIDVRYCGLDYDPLRQRHLLWCGDDRVWTLTPPATLAASGWMIQKAPTPTTAAPNQGTGTGILGKWKYIPNLDVFMGLADANNGDIWIYKPVGWSNPNGGNLPPQVSLSTPADGSRVTLGASVPLAATASDSDGNVVQVSFRVNGAVVATVNAPPFQSSWTPASTGTYTLTAVATDNGSAATTSAPVTLHVDAVPQPNVPPAVALTQPAGGATVTQGGTIQLAASAADSDGNVVRVEFYADSTLIGQATQSPYTFAWTNASVGSHTLMARAVDDDGASTDSATVAITVVAGGGSGSVTLQRGVGSATVVDTYLSSFHQSSNFGTAASTPDQKLAYSPLLRFAIFQSEGGPVPNGATIDSAVLSVYKSSAYDMIYGLHAMLQPWSESASNWTVRLPGAPWGAAGANQADVDYAATPDALGVTGWDPGWIHFDVTATLAGLSAQPTPVHHGWRLRQFGGYVSGLKKLHSSEYTVDSTLRPKLVITYH